MKLNANRQVVGVRPPGGCVGKWLFISALARKRYARLREGRGRAGSTRVSFVTIAVRARPSRFETINCHARELPRSEKRQELERRPKAVVLSSARVRVRAVIVL